MWFYVSFGLSVLITLGMLFFIRYQKKKQGIRNNILFIRYMTIVIVIDLVLMLLPYFFYFNVITEDEAHGPYNAVLSLPYIVIRLLQSASLDADYPVVFKLDHAASLVPGWFQTLYITVLSYLSFLFPVMGALTVTSAFYGRMGYYYAISPLSRWSSLYVFNEMNAAAMALIESIDKEHPNSSDVRYIFCNMAEDPSGDAADRLADLKVSYSKKGPAAILHAVRRHLPGAHLEFLFLGENEDLNLDDTADVLEAVGEMTGPADKDGKRISKYADSIRISLVTQSREVDGILDNLDKYGVRVRSVDRELENVYDLYQHWPLFLCWDAPDSAEASVHGNAAGAQASAHSAAAGAQASARDTAAGAETSAHGGAAGAQASARDTAAGAETSAHGGAAEAKQTVSMLILGASPTSHEAFRTSVWFGQMDRMNYRATYVAPDADKFQSEMKARYPGLFDPAEGGGNTYDLKFWNMSLEQLILAVEEEERGKAAAREYSSRLAEVNYIIIAAEDDERNISIGMQLRSWICRRYNGTDERPFLSVLIRNDRKAKKLLELVVQDSDTRYNLHAFGTDSRVFSYHSLLLNPVQKMLTNIEYSYTLSGSDSFVKENPEDMKTALRNAASELNKSTYKYLSSLSNAMYATTRLFDAGVLEDYLKAHPVTDASGREQVITDGTAQAGLVYDAFIRWYSDPEKKKKGLEKRRELLQMFRERTAPIKGKEGKEAVPAVLERLAYTEHVRWNAYMCSTGWITMSQEDMKDWVKAHGGAHKDYLALRHPCITEWEKLQAVSVIKKGPGREDMYQESDRIQVRRLPDVFPMD